MEKIKKHTVRLLRWSERYTKTDMLYLAKGGFWLGLNQVVGTGTGFVISLVFANLFPVSAYGTYKYIVSIAGILSAFSMTGMNTALIRAVAKGYSGLIKKSFRIQLKWNSLVIIPLTIAVSGYYLFQNNNILAIGTLIVGLLSPLSNAANTYSAYLVGEKRYRTVFFSNLISNIVNLASILFAVYWGSGVLILLLTSFLSQAVTLTVLYKKTTARLPESPEQEQETFGYGRHLSYINFLGVVAQNIDKIFTFQLLGAVPLAVYYFATTVPGQLGGLGKNIANLAFPRISEQGTHDDFKNTFGKTGRIVILFLCVSLAYIFIAPAVFTMLFPQYVSAIPYSQIFSISLIFSVPTLYLLSVLQARGDKKQLYTYNIATSLIAVLTAIIGIWWGGLWGLVGARIISSIISFTYALYLSKTPRSTV